jgi:hypothetical protein
MNITADGTYTVATSGSSSAITLSGTIGGATVQFVVDGSIITNGAVTATDTQLKLEHGSNALVTVVVTGSSGADFNINARSLG